MRKARLTIHIDDERKRYGLAGGGSPLYMEDLETIMDRIREKLLSGSTGPPKEE